MPLLFVVTDTLVIPEAAVVGTVINAVLLVAAFVVAVVARVVAAVDFVVTADELVVGFVVQPERRTAIIENTTTIPVSSLFGCFIIYHSFPKRAKHKCALHLSGAT